MKKNENSLNERKKEKLLVNYRKQWESSEKNKPKKERKKERNKQTNKQTKKEIAK